MSTMKNNRNLDAIADGADSAVPNRRGAVAIVVRSSRLLVIRRSQYVVAPGALCFPGGGIEPTESEPEALIREIREELGTIVEPVACLWRSVTSWGVEIAWWQAELDGGTAVNCNPAEVAEVLWLTPQELADHPDVLESNRHFLEATARGEIVVQGL